MASTTPLSFAKVSSKPTSGITPGRLYFVNSTTANKSNLYLGINSTTLAQIGATIDQGNKADNAVDMSSDQTNILGNKTWKGTQLWNGTTEHRVYSTSTSNDNIEVVGADYNKDESSTSGNYFNTSMQNRFTPTGQYLSVSGSKHNSDQSIYDMPYMSAIYELGFFSAFSRVNLPRISFAITNEGLFNNTSFQYDSSFGVYSSSPLSGAASYFHILHYENYGQTENKLSYDCHGNFSIAHNKDYGETTYNFEIIPQNDDYYIGDSSRYGLVSVNNIVNACATCFRGDTSYITMADGSKKLIQDIKVGDVVKGYDVNKKDYTDAVVLQNVKTGEERAFDCYVMDDGTTVDIFNNDGFICCVGKRKMLPHRDADGDYINVYSMKTLFSFHERKDDQRRIIKEDGNLENTTCVIHKFQADCAHRTARYTLYTSNGTFFVNGLLHGLASRSIPQYFKTYKITTPDYIDKIFDGILLDLAQRDESLPDTHIENPDKVSDLATLNKAKATIAWAKNKLSETDYKARKYVEGEISEEEWTAIKEQAAEWRKTVNDNEAIVEEYTEKVKKDNPAMFDTTSEEPEHVVRHAQWLKHQKTYDDNYKLFKQWADERVSYKEEQREKARKEHEQKKAEYEARKAEKLAKQNSNKEVK